MMIPIFHLPSQDRSFTNNRFILLLTHRIDPPASVSNIATWLGRAFFPGIAADHNQTNCH